MTSGPEKSLQEKFAYRFGDPPACHDPTAENDTLAYLAGRRSHRRYLDRPVDPALIETLSAAAFSAPTKSDLQQRDIVILQDPSLRENINSLFPEDSWMGKAPAFLIFCGNNRRQRQLHQWRGRPFANDHLDAFFNAAVDAAIVLATFVVAAERVGLGCCPISAVRNHAGTISDLLGLPDHVFPVAGMTLGWPEGPGEVSLRLPLDVTLHKDRFNEDGLRQRVEAYDDRRDGLQPLSRQRYAGEEGYGTVTPYTWSEDKARQYSKPERADFGAFIRSKGFNLD
ncbi:MAG: nitroreductase family protein [Rhodospirillales bacterium]|nr:nitroreductase family protein [Alphaproteobacteria bacterium]MBL6947714.1 nitroreductase family protein [Rhodospirillales bacterium]